MSLIYAMLKEDNAAAIMFATNGGPEFSSNSILNAIFYYHFSKKKNFDIISASTYVARYSAFKPIEHLWSPLSNRLSSLKSCY